MADKRMFAKSVIDSDTFLDMPMSARLLYYDLGMRADDDGFVDSPKKIMKIIGASTDDMNILISRNFIIPFESGIVVIRHWRINNYLRSDRYKSTTYTDEKSRLALDPSNRYLSENEAISAGIPLGIPTVNPDKNRIDENRIDKINNINTVNQGDADELFLKLWSMYPFIKAGKADVSAAKKRKIYSEVGEEQFIRCLERLKEHKKNEDPKYVCRASTFFNTKYVDYLDENYKETMNIKDDVIPESSIRQTKRKLQ